MSVIRTPVRLKGRSKYAAAPTVVDGIRFASKREAQRYGELKLLEKAGAINRLRLQPKFPLTVVGETIGHYVGDFQYYDVSPNGSLGRCVVEDVKGVATALYKWKKKHVEAQYGIQIREIR